MKLVQHILLRPSEQKLQAVLIFPGKVMNNQTHVLLPPPPVTQLGGGPLY